MLSAASANRRLRNLDNPVLVAAVCFAASALYLHGAVRSEYTYGDARFVVDYFATEVRVTILLALGTITLFPPDRIGLRWPRFVNGGQARPALALAFAALAGWGATRLTAPAGTLVDNAISLQVFRTTLLVGLTEEWIFRGLLLAALCRGLGLRRGAVAAVVLFGLFHLTNIAAGAPVMNSVAQAFSTMLIGSVFTLAAIGTRSLAIPVLVHGSYDFAVFDTGSLMQAGASPLPMVGVLAVGLITGIIGLIGIARLRGPEPFAP